MKLSMWMIANRLSALDPEIHIRDQAPIVLRSARRAYATNCVHVFQVGKDVICNGEGNYFRLKDMSAGQAFEIIQCIFDFYDDWNTEVMEAANRMDYQQVIDESWHIFHNPVLLLDANCKVLAMSAQYAEGDIDQEWKHLSEHGYVSASGFAHMRRHALAEERSRTDRIRLIHGDGNRLSTDWMIVPLTEDGTLLGWLNILEFERKFNMGDVQLLNHLTSLLIPSLSRLNEKNSMFSSMNVFWEMICKKWISPDALDRQLAYMGWDRRDDYRVFLFTARENENGMNLCLVRRLISSYIPQASVLQAENRVVLIINEKQLRQEQVKQASEDIWKQEDIRIGVSLSVAGIRNLHAGYRQAEAALKYGSIWDQKEHWFDFYDYAIDFIVENSDLEELVMACQPDVLRLWKAEQKDQGGRLDILKSYLENERSLVNTANALFVHRNTLVYRIKKILEEFQGNLEDDYTRDYVKLSIRILELYRKKGKS